MVTTCAEPGCSTLCLGRMCIVHEPKVARVFVRGRPWPPAGQLLTGVAIEARTTSATQVMQPVQTRSLVDT